MSIKSQELKRADFAYSYIKREFKTEEKPSKESLEVMKNFKSYVMNVPAYIKTNGLLATYAFIGTKMETTAYKKIYEMTKEWLRSDACSVKESVAIGEKEDLKGKFLSLSSNEYKLVTKEVLALFHWVKRFAVSELDTDKDKDKDEDEGGK